MATRTYRTNLRCAGCLDAIRPHLNALPGIKSWNVDLERTDKPLTVEGENTDSDQVRTAMKKAGYELLGEVKEESTPSISEPKPSYYPLVMILVYLLLAVTAAELALGSFDWMRAMRHFMAGFFLIFSFFKLLDLRGFADSYAMYDLIAAKWFGYGFVYPFLELGLGLAYLANVAPLATNIITLVLMSIGTAGVVRTIFQKRQVRCACLGTVIQLPVATVTLLEDAGMAAMAAGMLTVKLIQ
jgi:copper chaperone CopZ